MIEYFKSFSRFSKQDINVLERKENNRSV